MPIGGEFNQESFVQDLYEKAVNLFQSDNEEEAINLLKAVVKLSPDYEDAYEAIGVILGRQEKFQEGIEFMDKVLEANPDSVMAHTNKSLFYMRLGKIEEAEEEKAQATVKSFSQYGKEAQQKKAKEEQRKAEEAEIERRFDMFKQVLEIDPDDNLANYGLADIYFQRGEAEKSIPLLEKVISVDKNYSVAYLLLGKVFLNTENKDKAREVFKRGIEIASAQGDLMPANEMQAKLSGL
ncbi:MAG: tetratricopeptide repeat protein [Bdellovibrionota bacterium]|nr:tetratricopeptide repeat protein [Bdellovibrionota bacterium]